MFLVGLLWAAGFALAGEFWLVVDGGQSNPGVGQVVRGIGVDDDAGHGRVVDAGDEVADVLVSGERGHGLEIGLVAGFLAIPVG